MAVKPARKGHSERPRSFLPGEFEGPPAGYRFEAADCAARDFLGLGFPAATIKRDQP